MLGSIKEIKTKQNKMTLWVFRIPSLRGNGTNETKMVNFPFDFILNILQTHLLPCTLALL